VPRSQVRLQKVRAQRKQAVAENKRSRWGRLARREAEAAEAAADLLREVELEEQNAAVKKAKGKGKGKGKKDAGSGSLCVFRCSGVASWALVAEPHRADDTVANLMAPIFFPNIAAMLLLCVPTP
jgi:hypothetical protein